MFQYGGLVLSPCLSFPESPVGESRVTSSKSPVASIQSLRSETRSRSVGRSSHHWNRVPGLAVLTMPTASWIGFPPVPRRTTARPPGTAPGRYRSSPSRLTSSLGTLWEAPSRYRGYPPRDAPRESNPGCSAGHEKTGVRRLVTQHIRKPVGRSLDCRSSHPPTAPFCRRWGRGSSLL